MQAMLQHWLVRAQWNELVQGPVLLQGLCSFGRWSCIGIWWYGYARRHGGHLRSSAASQLLDSMVSSIVLLKLP